MFGDPAVNAAGWPTRLISDIADVITGNTPPRKNPSYYGNYIEWIKSDNITDSDRYVTEAEEWLSEAGSLAGRTAPPGSILVTCIAGSPSSIGSAAMTDRKVAFNQQINAIIPRQGEALFFYVQLAVAKKLVQHASTGGMKGLVSKSRLKQLELINPPLPLQRTFASRVEAIERQKSSHRAHLAELDELFASLQDRAFAGEL
jgi:type I restriction enzyme S subunit